MQYTTVCTQQKATQMEISLNPMTFPSGVDGEQTDLNREHLTSPEAQLHIKADVGPCMWVFKGAVHLKINNTYYSPYQ